MACDELYVVRVDRGFITLIIKIRLGAVWLLVSPWFVVFTVIQRTQGSDISVSLYYEKS